MLRAPGCLELLLFFFLLHSVISNWGVRQYAHTEGKEERNTIIFEFFFIL
jgi:hypothetical protein